MYILKNAWTSITRNKGRNILIAIIIIVIATSCTITLSILNSANKIVKSYEEKYDVEASIAMDRMSLMDTFKEEASSQEEMIEKFNDIESITVQDIDNYANSEYVKEYYYSYNISYDAKNLEEATDNLIKETTEVKTETKTFGGGDKRPGFPGGNFGGTQKKTTTTKTEEIKNIRAEGGAFSLVGYSSYKSMSDFIAGNYTITEGEVSSDFTTDTCVISEELATLNELSVGDEITLVSPNDTKITYKLTITGIYKENSDASRDMTNMFTSSANTIITNSQVVSNIVSKDEKLTPTLTPTFILKSKDIIDAFQEEVEAKGLSKYYTVTNNLSTIEKATESITNVKTFAKTFLIITMLIGGVVLFVINMINIRERKYEIGVLRTIGMKKTLVITQFLIEIMLVAICGLIIGVGIGATTSVDIANNLLATEVSNAQTNYDKINENFGGKMKNNERINGTVNIETVDTMNAIVDYKVVLELLAIGLSLTIISSVASCVAIARFSPLTILKERS